jgi:Lon protease-like protein
MADSDSEAEDLSFDAQQFSGRVRLFPLPNLVLFPHVMQPLHIFEPRYRALLEDALTGDRLIALGLFAPGWEKNYEGRPPLQAMACLGRIATHQRLADHRYNVLLLGLKRVRITRELPSEKLFREAEVEVCEDVYPSSTSPTRSHLQQQLAGAFKHVLPSLGDTQDQFDELLKGELPLGILTDIVSYTLDLGMEIKEQLLNECNVDRRAALLLDHLKSGDSVRTIGRAGFPPAFSIN